MDNEHCPPHFETGLKERRLQYLNEPFFVTPDVYLREQ